MKAEQTIEQGGEVTTFANAHLLREAFSGLDPLLSELRDLEEQIDQIAQMGDSATQKAMRRLGMQLDNLEPSITMIGQVKAGKTTLVNALAGWPDLLPADVNPWTSVVTSLHFDPNQPREETKSSFKFFESEEWDWLINRGGRIGELASRAGAEDELDKVRNQVAEMREKSKRRLGKKFELLLGQKHDYGYFDSELIERYVCLGDDFDDEPGSVANQGRFADITRSADLFVSRPEFPMKMCIRDTPGVNDTFMMREQITIRATRDSRICVLVLSAHQALSTVDMALIRLIANVKARDIVIFVNRIDELSDPTNQIPEIETAIRKTLKDHQGPSGAQIVFGSGYWANAALSGQVGAIAEASAAALVNLAEGNEAVANEAATTEDLIWQLSGVPALCDALSERIVEGVGHEAVQSVARTAVNHARGLQASDKVVELRAMGDALAGVDKEAFALELDKIELDCKRALKTRFDTIVADFDKRLERSHRSFLERATSALVTHLETKGEQATWQYDPTGLRVLLRTAYRVFATNSRRGCDEVLKETATQITQVYGSFLGDDAAAFEVATPEPPGIPAPVLLGQTIALDVQGSLWTRWWRKKRGARAYAQEFAELIKAETDPIVSGLREAHAGSIREAGEAILEEFLADQRAILTNVAKAGEAEGVALGDERSANLESALDRLSEIAA